MIQANASYALFVVLSLSLFFNLCLRAKATFYPLTSAGFCKQLEDDMATGRT